MSNRIMPFYPEQIDMPFAHLGDKQEIPVSSDSAGKATLSEGFPVECSKPLEVDGVPPMRTDMNGVLNLLTQWAFYAQSGGLAMWNDANNYIVPSLVSHNGIIYTCIKENGPATSVGSKQPGAAGSEDYWTVGLGAPATATCGNNANLYLLQGTYWIPDDQAISNFPKENVGGWLNVLSHQQEDGTYLLHQSFFCRDNFNQVYARHSTDGETFSQWVKVMYQSDLGNMAYMDCFQEPTSPNDALGKDRDMWIAYM